MDKIDNDPQQMKGYSQGGTVVDGIAYFTSCSYQEKLAEDGTMSHVDKTAAYPYVAAFDVNTLEMVKAYPFEDTYDSTPLVAQTKDGTWLVLAHEHAKARTVAMERDTAQIAWISEANQPGSMFFGYSFYRKRDGTQLILACCSEGLHAMSLENGKDEWFVPSAEGVTPCVDQEGGFVYYQASGSLYKIAAETGEVLKSVAVDKPNLCVSWNTVLANDEHGCHILTYWYSRSLYGSAIRVYDAELKLQWEKFGLPMSKKATLTYHGGTIFAGCGDHWQKQQYLDLADTSWRKVTAYHVTSGEVKWQLDLSRYEFSCLPNIIYCNGMLIAETQTNLHGLGYLVLVMDAADGTVLKEYNRPIPANSCAAPAFSGGRLFSGDLITDSVLVTDLGAGDSADWIGAFGNGQTNDMCAPDQALRRLL